MTLVKAKGGKKQSGHLFSGGMHGRTQQQQENVVRLASSRVLIMTDANDAPEGAAGKCKQNKVVFGIFGANGGRERQKKREKE